MPTVSASGRGGNQLYIYEKLVRTGPSKLMGGVCKSITLSIFRFPGVGFPSFF
jgi:hypothetical protein